MRGAPLAYLAGLYAGRHRIPEDAITEDGRRLHVRLSAAWAERVAAQGLTILCRPLEFPPGAEPDARALGMPLFAMTLQTGQ